jgi:hypothetical protein
MTTTNREDWLNAATSELRPFFSAVGKLLPANVRVTCGFPSNAKRSGAIGECWADTASADKTFEVLISPVLDDPTKVFEVLVHELCHATAGAMNHGVNFQKVANLMHLAPSPTKAGWKATGQAATFAAQYGDIIKSLDAYPHAALSMTTKKTQGTRMLKAVCPSCGYTVRLTSKWAALGLPSCPQDSDILNLA